MIHVRSPLMIACCAHVDVITFGNSNSLFGADIMSIKFM